MWAARDTEQLLEELGELGRRFRKGEQVKRPRVTLWLASGREASGLVLDVHQNRSGARTVMLQLVGKSNDVLLLPTQHLQAVTLHDVEPAEIVEPPPPSASSPLMIKRHARAVEQRLGQILGRPFELAVVPTEDAGQLLALEHALTKLEPVLVGLTADTVGKEAFVAAVKQLALVTGLAQKLTAFEGIFTITAPVQWAKFDAAALQRELEALL